MKVEEDESFTPAGGSLGSQSLVRRATRGSTLGTSMRRTSNMKDLQLFRKKKQDIPRLFREVVNALLFNDKTRKNINTENSLFSLQLATRLRDVERGGTPVQHRLHIIFDKLVKYLAVFDKENIESTKVLLSVLSFKANKAAADIEEE